MDRLTNRNNDMGGLPVFVRGRALGPAYFSDERDYKDYADALERLAQYEDAGLSPDEIHELVSDSTGPLHKKLGQWINAEKQGRLVVLPEPTPDIDFMRIFNLVMADAEDRVIVLPCKVGDAIFLIERGNILEEKVLGFIEAGCGLIMNVTYRDYVTRPKCKNIGKLLDGDHLSVFLTREEAEAAIKEAMTEAE